MNERYILGSKINDISLEQAIKQTKELLFQPGVHYIVTPNSEICLKGYRNHKLMEITKSADICLPDGFGLKIGGWILDQNITNIVPGVDFSYALIKIAQESNLSILLIGGKGKSGTKAIENLKLEYPKLNVNYLNGGEFNSQGDSEFPDFIPKINEMKPDIILVNLGAPKQEYFMFNNLYKLQTKLMVGVGGTIDFLSGNSKRAPRWVNKIGMEWLFRLVHEPWRWKRIFNAVILFPLTCIWWKIRNLTVYRKSVVGLIINNKKEILLMKRSPRISEPDPNDHWQLPQGGVEVGENPDTAVLREMGEEVGLHNLKILGKVNNCSKYNWDKNSLLFMPYKGQKQSLYLLRYDGVSDEVIPDKKEFNDFKWLVKEQAVSLANPKRKHIINIGIEKFKNYL